MPTLPSKLFKAVSLPADLHRQIKSRAAMENITFTAMLAEIVRQGLERSTSIPADRPCSD